MDPHEKNSFVFSGELWIHSSVRRTTMAFPRPAQLEGPEIRHQKVVIIMVSVLSEGASRDDGIRGCG